LIEGIFTLNIPILLILLFNAILLLVSWLTILHSCPIMTTCESVSAILVLPTNPKVVAVVGVILGGILLISCFFLLL
jgi:uncharacterized membrane-anchored protein YitT (DUF2179 family)